LADFLERFAKRTRTVNPAASARSFYVQIFIDYRSSLAFFCFTLAVSAQTLPPAATMAARSLVATMKFGEQCKMLLWRKIADLDKDQQHVAAHSRVRSVLHLDPVLRAASLIRSVAALKAAASGCAARRDTPPAE